MVAEQEFSRDPHAFLFSFSSNCWVKYRLIDVNCRHAVWNAPNYGPTFGRGADLFICHQSNEVEESYSKLPSSYRDPTGKGNEALTDMLVEECSSLVAHLLVVGFHHKRGHQIEYSFPRLNEPIADRWSNVGALALPDGAHNRQRDLIYFHLPSLDDRTIFGIASYRQIDVNSQTNKEADVTRNSIQKSVCLLLRRPLYGSVASRLQSVTEEYFSQNDFNARRILDELVEELNNCPPLFSLENFSVGDLIVRYRRKALVLFKLILLQKKILFLLSPVETLVQTMLTVVSLIPGLIERGLDECTLIVQKPLLETKGSLTESEDIVFDRDDSEMINFDNIRLKTDEDEEVEEQKESIFKRASSIPGKLSDAFHRLSLSSSPSISVDCPPQLNDLDQYGFPLELFRANNLFHPYLSIHSLDTINSPPIESFVIGATNGLFRQQRHLDVVIVDREDENSEEIVIQSASVRQQVQLTTADLRFVQLFDNGESEVELRRLFTTYLLSLLSVARCPNEEALNDFNSSFVAAFQSTDAFRRWQRSGPYPSLDKILPRHPQAGQLNVADVKLRVAHVLQDTEAGRKLKGAVQETSQFMGETSRAASKAFEQAKSSLFTSVIGTFNQGKQWLAKPQPTND